jgi:Na+(H+)/acetate symporter ActP
LLVYYGFQFSVFMGCVYMYVSHAFSLFCSCLLVTLFACIFYKKKREGV